VVVEPNHVARQVLKAIDRDRRETFVPRWYRAAAVAQALAPGLLARLSARAGYRN
jgi:short-subunit dehydrogenase